MTACLTSTNTWRRLQISIKILDKYQSAVLDTDTSVKPADLLKEVIGPLTVHSASLFETCSTLSVDKCCL